MLSWVRFVGLAGSFSLHKMLLEPREFFTLVARKFATSHAGEALRLPMPPMSRRLAMGDISGVEDMLHRSRLPWAMLRPIRRSIGQFREQWDMSILAAPAPGPAAFSVEDGEPELRMYSLHTNSLPYTQSGYTIRSKQTMDALEYAGVAYRAATRLGYPVVIGSRPAARGEEEVGNRFDRLLPTFFPWGYTAQVERAVALLEARVRAFNPTVLHTTTDFKNAQVMSRVAHRFGLPWIYEVRGEPEKTWLSKFPKDVQPMVARSERFERLRAKETEAMQAASAVIALSEVSKSMLVERGVAPDKITVIPNAIEHSFTGLVYDREAIRRELGLDVARPLVGAITSVVGYEGLDTLVKAAALSDAFDVVIVGSGTVLPALQGMVRERGLEERVRFVGTVPSAEAWKWYAALDVCAVPRKDTDVCRTVTPLKPLMALALGIPVVGSDLPALQEVTGGHLIAHTPEDPQSLVNSIGRALTVSGEDKARLREWAQTRTWEANAERYRAVLRTLLSGGADGVARG